MTILTMSFSVVIKGPEATAGSIFNLLIIIGMTQPMKVANPNARKTEPPTINASGQFPL